MSNRLAFLIMAAGQSKRLGQPKQLIKYHDMTLLERQVNLASSFSSDVYTVLGFNADEIINNTSLNKSTLFINKNWQKGLGNSISYGVKCLPQAVDAVMIFLVDQWRLSQQDLALLITTWRKNNNNIITASDDVKSVISPPIIFPRDFFSDLENIKEGSGAKSVLNKYCQQTIRVNTPSAFDDIDTPEQLNTFNAQVNN